eukprot:13618525-Alexandrium_andersonii.AAC.1
MSPRYIQVRSSVFEDAWTSDGSEPFVEPAAEVDDEDMQVFDLLPGDLIEDELWADMVDGRNRRRRAQDTFPMRISREMEKDIGHR